MKLLHRRVLHATLPATDRARRIAALCRADHRRHTAHDHSTGTSGPAPKEFAADVFVRWMAAARTAVAAYMQALTARDTTSSGDEGGDGNEEESNDDGRTKRAKRAAGNAQALSDCRLKLSRMMREQKG